MTATTLKRRYHSSSASESSTTWAPLRPKCGLPTRRNRKVARVASSHRIISIAPALQQHRSRDVSFSSSDTEVSSAETELGTALSENEIESALHAAQEKSSSSEKSRSDGEMELSSPSKEENEVEDDLGCARTSSSPSPPPVGWQWTSEKMSQGMYWPESKGKGKAVEGRDCGDAKRRKIHKEVEAGEEADDEMDDADGAEDMTVTPKQKTFRHRKCPDLSIQYARSVAPTPSIQRITEGFHGLTPYCMEMQISPDRPSFRRHSHNLSDLLDPHEVDAALLASPSPGPSKKRPTKSHAAVKHSHSSAKKKLSHKERILASRARKSEKEREQERRRYAVDPFCHPDMLSKFRPFDRAPVPAEPVEQSSEWAYGPLSSPIRLASDTPTAPIRSRIAGQRMQPNKHLQRKSPTSLVPSRHHQRGRLLRSRHQPQRLYLPLIGSSALVGQHVVDFVLEQKEARLKRRHAVSRQNAQIDHDALFAMRARSVESLATVDAFKNTLENIRKGCWWWAPVPPKSEASPTSDVSAARRLAAARSIEEVQVDCMVGNVAREAVGDAEAVLALVSEREVTVTLQSRPNRRRRVSSPPQDVERAIRAEAAQSRMRDQVTVIETIAEAVQVEAASHQSRTASRTIARREREAERTLSSDRAAAQRRRLGRQQNPVVEVIQPAPHRHTSALNPAWLEAAVIPPAPPAPADLVEPVVEAEGVEDTDVDSDTDTESVVSEPPAYDSSTYPRHIPRPAHLVPRQPPSPIQTRLPSYAINRYSRRSPSPPPPYNAETDRQTLVAPMFIGEDDEDEVNVAVAVALEVREQRVIGAYPSGPVGGHAWGGEERGRSRFEAALEMEEGEDADLIDELTGAYGAAGVGARAAEGSVAGVIGGFFGRIFGRR